MVKTCLTLVAGMLAAQLSSFADVATHLNLVFVVSCALLFARHWRLAATFACGAGLFFIAAADLIEERIPRNIEGDSIVVQFELLEFPIRRDSSLALLARPLDDARLPERVRLSWFEPEHDPQLGEIWQLEVRLRRPRGSRNPGGFDYEAWLFREQVATAGYVVNSWRNKRLAVVALPPVQRVRKAFDDRIAALVGDTEAAAVISAIVIGARHRLSAEQWERYAVTGTSHLMAISGLHIGLAAVGAYVVARLLSGGLVPVIRHNSHLLAIVVALFVAVAYVQVSGFALPARRAGLMLCLTALLVIALRPPDAKFVVSMAGMFVVTANPLATMSPGFALSFGAVITLLWVGQRRVLRLPAMQLSLLFTLVPLTVIFFDRVSLVALPVNLVAVPFFSLVTVPLALAGFVLDGPFRPLGDVLLVWAGQSVELLDHLLRVAAELPWASRPVAALTGVAWLYLLLPPLWAVLPPRWPGRSVAWLGLVGLLLYAPRSPDPGCARITVLDVGQGLAVAVQTHTTLLLYDTGPAYRSGGSAAQNVIVPFLQSRGIRHIDTLVVSHGDQDHAGGVAPLLQQVSVGRVIAGEPLADIAWRPCHAGQSWQLDGIDFTMLYPAAHTGLEGNDSSCVLLVEAGGYRLLLTGDIEKAAERALLREATVPRVQVVTVPHHGSRTSSTPAFVRVLQPSVAVVSAAYGNHWGLPKEDIVARWQAAGAEVLNTADTGAVELSVCAASGFTFIRAYRAVKRRIWHE